jgi:hypothetical protein
MSTVMRIFAHQLLLFLGALGVAHAGGDGVVRKEFKQSDTYPYVFRPICYLATSGPVPLRFSVAAPECGDRRAPKLTGGAKTNPKPEPPLVPVLPPVPPAAVEPAPVSSATSSSAGPAPAYPPPENAPAPKPASVDFAQFPVELVEAFKKGREGAETRNYLFDPIFQPALPDDLPKSKATYRQTK